MEEYFLCYSLYEFKIQKFDITNGQKFPDAHILKPMDEIVLLFHSTFVINLEISPFLEQAFMLNSCTVYFATLILITFWSA